MVKYTFTLQIKGSNESFNHELQLQKHQEDAPERFFTKEVCETIRRELQRKSSCKINDAHLSQIVQKWIQDIRVGYRDSKLTLDLPPRGESEIDNLSESGNQAIPAIIYPSLDDVEPRVGALPPLVFS